VIGVPVGEDQRLDGAIGPAADLRDVLPCRGREKARVDDEDRPLAFAY